MNNKGAVAGVFCASASFVPWGRPEQAPASPTPSAPGRHVGYERGLRTAATESETEMIDGWEPRRSIVDREVNIGQLDVKDGLGAEHKWIQATLYKRPEEQPIRLREGFAPLAARQIKLQESKEPLRRAREKGG